MLKIVFSNKIYTSKLFNKKINKKMNRSKAKKIAETITNTQLAQMFETAKSTVDWMKVSSINQSFTKGVAWNILAKDFDITKNYSTLVKMNMIREFGEFLPNEIKPIKPNKPKLTPYHQKPIF